MFRDSVIRNRRETRFAVISGDGKFALILRDNGRELIMSPLGSTDESAANALWECGTANKAKAEKIAQMSGGTIYRLTRQDLTTQSVDLGVSGE